MESAQTGGITAGILAILAFCFQILRWLQGKRIHSICCDKEMEVDVRETTPKVHPEEKVEPK
jgi:hypothetical protein